MQKYRIDFSVSTEGVPRALIYKSGEDTETTVGHLLFDADTEAPDVHTLECLAGAFLSDTLQAMAKAQMLELRDNEQVLLAFAREHLMSVASQKRFEQGVSVYPGIS